MKYCPFYEAVRRRSRLNVVGKSYGGVRWLGCARYNLPKWNLAVIPIYRANARARLMLGPRNIFPSTPSRAKVWTKNCCSFQISAGWIMHTHTVFQNHTLVLLGTHSMHSLHLTVTDVRNCQTAIARAHRRVVSVAHMHQLSNRMYLKEFCSLPFLCEEMYSAVTLEVSMGTRAFVGKSSEYPSI